ncbi:MAG TPA: OmpH family outer membrane protein [Flavisolibacter sp.]|nr:OmpH family outer membrane protein [Flavisolibacter sp.]
MNKIKLVIVAAIFLVSAAQVNAQKTGYISVEQAVSIMPEVGKIDTALQKFQTDSLNAEFASLIQEYNYKDSLLTKTDTTKIPAAVKRQHRQDLESIAYQVQNWQQISQNVMQSKQQQLLEPVYRKLMATIQTVAKENGYTYVYNKEALLVAPPADDLLPLVAKKLNIKIPTAPQGAANNRPGANPR